MRWEHVAVDNFRLTGAAKLTGLLLFALPGTDQAAWGEREVDISNEVAQALSLMEPPVNAPKQRVEQTIVAACGNIEEAKQVSRRFIQVFDSG